MDINKYWNDHIKNADADAIGDLLYTILGTAVNSGVVKDFNAASYGPDVRDGITKIAMLIRAYMEKTNDSVKGFAEKVRFGDDGVHFDKELFVDPDGGGTSQAVLHGQRTLNSNDDLNDILDQGFYFYRSGTYHLPTETDPTVGNVPGNYPTKTSSLVAVFSTNGGTVKAQIAHNSNNRIDYRVKVGSGEFTDWTKLINRSDANMPTDQECIDAGANIFQFIQTKTKSLTNGDMTFTWSKEPEDVSGYWKLTGDTPDDTDIYFRFVDSPSEIPLGIVPGKEYRIGLYCEINGQQYIDNAGPGEHPIYLRFVQKIQSGDNINRSYFASNSDTALTIDDNCVGLIVDCYVRKNSSFNGPVIFRPFMKAARTNAEITEKTKRIRVRELAKEDPDDPDEPIRTGLYFDAAKMFVGAQENNNKEILHYQRILTRNDSLADIKEAGIYVFQGNSRPLDSPTTATSCVWAIVSPTGKYRSLILINTLNRMYHCSWDGAAWTDWNRVVDREDHGETRDVPKNSGVYNAYRRAHQLIDLKFEPSGIYDTKRNKIPANSPEYIGIPHSSVKEAELFLGFDVSLRTFMTAIHNPYSLMHTECVQRNDNSVISEYGMNYRGSYGTQGPFYGTSCSSFVLHSLGLKSRWTNANFEYLVEQGVLSHVKDNSPTGVQLMDILQWQQTDHITPDHCVLVTDIYRNERGVPTEIWVSESTMAKRYVVNGEIAGDSETGSAGRKYIVVDGKVQEKVSGNYIDTDLTYNTCIGCRTTRLSFAQFKSYMTSHRIRIFRYNFIEDNLDYEPSDFVAVEDEAEPTYEYNDAICTYAGDYAVFRAGFPVHINYNKTGYTHMRVQKGTDITEPIDFPQGKTEYDGYSNGTHSIDVSDHCNYLGPGLYTAFLTDGTSNSASTHWEIIDTTTTVSGSMSDLTVNFNKNANPVYIEFVSERGNQWGLYELSAAEIEAGKVEGLNAGAYINQSIGKVPKYKYDRQGAPLPEEYYVRVKYQGEYGGVTSRMINVVDPTKAIGIDTDDAGNGTGDDTEE